MKALWLAPFLTALVPSAASAATVEWSSRPFVNRSTALKNLMGTDQFDQTGTQVFAVSTGNLSGRLEQTTDIVFAGSDPNLDTSSMPNNYTDFHENSGGNNEISRSGLYSDCDPAVVTIHGLQVGCTYRIQNLIFDGRGLFNGRTLEIDAKPVVTHANGTRGTSWGDGSLSTGTFVADAINQSFTIEVFNPSGSSAGGQLNAILLHKTIDAPGSNALRLTTRGETDRIAGQFVKEKFKQLLQLNRRYAEKAKKLQQAATVNGDPPAANAAYRQVEEMDRRHGKLVRERDNAVLIASLAGEWRLNASGLTFKIFTDGNVTSKPIVKASEPSGESGRIEVVDPEKRIVRMTGFKKPMTWVVAESGKTLLRFPVLTQAEMLAESQRDLLEALMEYTWGWHPQGSPVRLKFNEDGSVWHIGMHGKWALVAKRRILISPLDGHHRVLMEFNDDLSSWSEVAIPELRRDGELGGIRREARKQKK